MIDRTTPPGAIVLALWLACAALAGGAEARTVVLRSSGPTAKQWHAGQMLREPVRLRLVAGDRLTLLDDRGTRDLAGPVTLNDAQPRRKAAGRMPSWDDLAGATPRERAGGVRAVHVNRDARSTTAPRRKPDGLWLIDTTVAGDWCVADRAALALWRGNEPDVDTVTVSSGPGTARVSWAAGRLDAPWPAAITIANRTIYTLRGGAMPRAIILHTLDPGASLEALERQLADHQCLEQLSLLVDR